MISIRCPLSPHDPPQTAGTFGRWLEDSGLPAIEVYPAIRLVARGIKPQ
jgi:hypothetical protein